MPSDGEPAVALWVDPKAHADEVARFRSKIVAGPGDGDCRIWIASIGADGYGRPAPAAANGVEEFVEFSAFAEPAHYKG